jgi:hypothetical protein
MVREGSGRRILHGCFLSGDELAHMRSLHRGKGRQTLAKVCFGRRNYTSARGR